MKERVEVLVSCEGMSLVGFAPVERFEGASRGYHQADLLNGARGLQDLLRESDLVSPEVRREHLQEYFYSAHGYDAINRML